MQRSFKRMAAKVTAALALASLAFMPLANAATTPSTVTVTGNTATAENQPGWLLNRDTNTDTPFEFNEDQASIGEGSLYVKPIAATPADKFVAENFINTPVADVDSISYDFRIGTGGAATQEEQFYMNVYANFGSSSDLKFYDCRYNIVPTVGSTGAFTTVTFNPEQAYPVTQHSSSPFTCPAIPADMNDLSAGSNIRVFSLNLGDSSASDAGLDGYFDKVVVATANEITTYDFEPVIKVTSKDQCKNGGWETSNTPVFKNQGDCVSSFASNGKTKGNSNPISDFFSNLFDNK